MEEMLLKMVFPSEDRREGLYVSRVYNGGGLQGPGLTLDSLYHLFQPYRGSFTDR